MRKTLCMGFLFIVTIFLSAQTDQSFPYYRINLTVDPSEGLLKGEVSIEIERTDKAERQNKKIYLFLMLNSGEKPNPYFFPLLEQGGPEGFSPTWIHLEDIKINNMDTDWRYMATETPIYIDYNTEHLICEIDVPQNTRRETTLTISMKYYAHLKHIRGMDDYYFKDKMISRFFWLPYLVPDETFLERGTYSFPFFTFDAEITLPPGWEMAALGTDFTIGDGGVYRVKSAAPVCTFPLVFVQNHFKYETLLADGKTYLRVYSREGQEGAARMLATYGKDVLDYYAKEYFPLKTRNISMVQGSPGTWGMAASSVVILADGAFSGANRVIPDFLNPLFDFLVAHELGHMYFGIGSPPDFSRENYLSEGLTEYASLRYIEKKYGVWRNRFNRYHNDVAAKLIEYFMGKIDSLSWRGGKILSITVNKRAGWDQPLKGEPEDKIINATSATDYNKAFLIIKMLAQTLGEDDFTQALREYLLDNRYYMVTSERLKKSLEEYYGVELDEFFRSFIYGNDSLDYSIKGKLNSERDKNGGYRSELTIGKKGETSLPIPLKATVFLKDGTTEEFVFETTGEKSIITPEKVKYVGIDKNPAILDYNRKNNFYPRQLVPDWTMKDWLRNGAATLWTVEPYLQQDREGLYIGAGPKFYDRFSWDLFFSPFISVTTTEAESETDAQSVAFGAASSGSFNFPGFHSLGVSARVILPGTLELAALRYTKRFYTETELGYVGKYYYPHFYFSISGGMAELPFNPALQSAVNPYIPVSASLGFDSLVKWGTKIDLGNTLNYYFLDNKVEDRIALSLIQGFSLFPRTIIGLQITGSVGLGSLNLLQSSNVVLGVSSTAQTGLPYETATRIYLGIPFLNSIETSLLNLVVLQSINMVFFYDAKTAFSGPKDFFTGYNQSAGLLFLPSFRTMADATFSLGIGLGFDINKIVNNPGDASSYLPAFIINTDTLPLFYSNSIAY
ncbi:MAG: hypothetical protein DRP87_12640 [Spirochaetes bacterium]|nr:MAG: hypothetical protein DRP87_12640 [Spirochaetota bacterium]